DEPPNAQTVTAELAAEPSSWQVKRPCPGPRDRHSERNSAHFVALRRRPTGPSSCGSPSINFRISASTSATGRPYRRWLALRTLRGSEIGVGNGTVRVDAKAVTSLSTTSWT